MGVLRGSKIFVAAVFLLLGLTFIATTGTLIYEFYEDDWFTHMALYSHLFVFFPTFGILALFAFYIPAVVFTDMYWKEIRRYGRLRYVFGFLVLATLACGVAWMVVSSSVPTYWELAPKVLAEDKGSSFECGSPKKMCRRAPLLKAIKMVKEESERRKGLSAFTRKCTEDQLLEPQPSFSALRYCFASGLMLNAATCCEVQKKFSSDLARLYTDPAKHSLTGQVHAVLLPFKAFFLLVLFVVGLFLAIFRHDIAKCYAPLIPKIERGVVVGALAVLFFPAANHGFLQSASVTYGSFGDTIYPTLAPIVSIIFGAWTVMLTFFFFSRFQKDTESMMRIIGFLASAIAVFQYDQIIDYAVRFLGAGSDRLYVLFFIIIAIVGIGALHRFGADEVVPEKD